MKNILVLYQDLPDINHINILKENYNVQIFTKQKYLLDYVIKTRDRIHSIILQFPNSKNHDPELQKFFHKLKIYTDIQNLTTDKETQYIYIGEYSNERTLTFSNYFDITKISPDEFLKEVNKLLQSSSKNEITILNKVFQDLKSFLYHSFIILLWILFPFTCLWFTIYYDEFGEPSEWFKDLENSPNIFTLVTTLLFAISINILIFVICISKHS